MITVTNTKITLHEDNSFDSHSQLSKCQKITGFIYTRHMRHRSSWLGTKTKLCCVLKTNYPIVVLKGEGNIDQSRSNSEHSSK